MHAHTRTHTHKHTHTHTHARVLLIRMRHVTHMNVSPLREEETRTHHTHSGMSRVAYSNEACCTSYPSQIRVDTHIHHTPHITHHTPHIKDIQRKQSSLREQRKSERVLHAIAPFSCREQNEKNRKSYHASLPYMVAKMHRMP